LMEDSMKTDLGNNNVEFFLGLVLGL
jgi:hypothetical protein